MPRFIVRVGYEWKTPCYREVEVSAIDACAAAREALALSATDADFWEQSIECDGEAGPTEILAIDTSQK